MNLMQNLQNILGQSLSDLTGGKGGDSLSKLIGPAALGGLAGLLLSSKAARGTAAGALLAGGGTLLWNKYKDRIREANTDTPGYGQKSSPSDERTARLIRAMVFAAKSDGHIDAQETQAIQEKMRLLNLGPEVETLVNQAMEEPLDPARVAGGVNDENEALELYAISCAVIDIDHFMERSYLDALAKALHIPADVHAEVTGRP